MDDLEALHLDSSEADAERTWVARTVRETCATADCDSATEASDLLHCEDTLFFKA